MEKSQQKHHAEIKKKEILMKFWKTWNKKLKNDKINRRNLDNEVGASSWLTTLPIKKYGFCLDKQSFLDSLYIRVSDIPLIFPSNVYHHFVFRELHSSWNMLCHIQKVDLCLSGITNLETSELSYYRNAAEMSQQSM